MNMVYCNVNSAYNSLKHMVNNYAIKKQTRGGEITHEVTNVNFEVENLVDMHIEGINNNYLLGELAFYLSGSVMLSAIEPHSKFWKKVANEHNKVNSNYGFLSGLSKEKSYFDDCIRRLIEDINTRRAVIPFIDQKYPNSTKDFPCAISTQFLYNDITESIDVYVNLRSSDVNLGLPYDLIFFAFLTNILCKIISYPTGRMCVNIPTLHQYKDKYPNPREV